MYVLALGSFVTLEDPLSAVLSGLQVSDAFPPQAWRQARHSQLLRKPRAQDN